MSSLSFRTKLGYGFGHVLNDLCSAMWFTYLLIYFHHVLKFDSTLAGVVLLIGQIADAISTPFVGRELDRMDDLPICMYYGRRKTWHMIGTISVVISFPFIFFGCFVCTNVSQWSQLIYYAPFVIIFQFGWAATQISHLAILPHLTDDPHERTGLNAIRYAFTVGSTITVYCITWIVLGIRQSSSDAVLHEMLGQQYSTKFRQIVLIVLSIGIVFSLLFHILVKEERLPRRSSGASHVSSAHQPMGIKNWMKLPQFYQVAVIYMCTRLLCNLSQAYIPIYIQDTLILSEESIAYIPLVMYISGLVTTIVMKPANKRMGRKVTFIIGCLLALSSAIWILLGHSELYRRYFLYIVAALLGSGGSTMLVTSLSLTADLIGSNVESGGFVYGAMSFCDKLSNGLIVMLIQSLTPCMSNCNACRVFYSRALSGVCGVAAIIGIITTLSLGRKKVGDRTEANGLKALLEGGSDGGSNQNEDDNAPLLLDEEIVVRAVEEIST